MRWLPRRGATPVAPVEVVERAALPRGERPLAVAATTDGTWLLGTRARLVLVAADGAVSRLRWEEVEDAGWQQEEGVLQLREAGEFGAPRRTWSLGVEEEPSEFLQLLRERVTASIVLQRRAAVRGKRGVVVACRRNPTGGPLRWTAAFDPGVEPDDPAALDAAEGLLATLRRDLGELADS